MCSQLLCAMLKLRWQPISSLQKQFKKVIDQFKKSFKLHSGDFHVLLFWRRYVL